MDFQAKVEDVFRQVMPDSWFFPKMPLEAIDFKNMIESGSEIPSCTHFHDHSCNVQQIAKVVNVFKGTYKVYFLAHIIPLLLFKRKQLRKSPLKTILRLLKGWLKSMMFICSFAYWGRKAWCNLTPGKVFHQFNFNFLYIIASCSILFEEAGRRPEMAMYVFPRFIESVPKYLDRMNMLPKIPAAHNIFLAVSMGLIASCYYKDSKCIKSYIRYLISCIFGDSDLNQVTSSRKQSQSEVASRKVSYKEEQYK